MKNIRIILAIAVVAAVCYANIENTAVEQNNATEQTDNGVPTGQTEQAGKRNDVDGTTARRTKRSKRKYEMPAVLQGVPEHIIEHTGFTVSFNREHNNPNYVAWELTVEETEGTQNRSNNFLADPDVPEPHRVTTDDYKGSGYDRGHMCPAADMKWDSRAMTECFYMSNMCPQHHTLNAGGWQTLEDACRRWARQEGEVYIVCGPVYKKGRKHKTIGSNHAITVPNGFFKVVLSMREGHEKAIGFYYANNDSKQQMTQTAMSVDDVEEMTGYNFFVNVPKRIEQRVEASFSLKEWN